MGEWAGGVGLPQEDEFSPLTGGKGKKKILKKQSLHIIRWSVDAFMYLCFK